MITTEIYEGQGLGNQLWCYVVTRVIALDRGYDFGIIHPEQFKCLDFLNLDFGREVDERMAQKMQHYSEKAMRHPDTGADIRLYDKDLVTVPNNTEINGIMQDEQYIVHRKDKIRQWLALRPEYVCTDFADDNTCIINFRGGEYAMRSDLFLSQKYWNDAVEHMRTLNKNFRFVVITDDVTRAKKFFPQFDVFHFNIGKDYAIIQSARYLILSNSSFAWFPAWLNTDLKLCIAPKYWARHNVSDGYWSAGYNITSGWMYMDRNGTLQNYDTCVIEFREYIIRHPHYFTATIHTGMNTTNKNIAQEKSTEVMTRTLDQMALGYGTDKSSLVHNYTKLYTFYFEALREKKLKILEIGIDKGFSLKSWKEYFPYADITGLDILDLKHFEEDRVHVEIGDQADTAFLQKVNDMHGPFDIIIDDGSHINSDMKASFDFLFPLLKQGGMYVVEDLHGCYWKSSGEPVFIDRLKELVDQVNSSGKSGVANMWRDSEDKVFTKKMLGEMNWWERNVEYMHLYRSIVFIKKYPSEPMSYAVERGYKKVKREIASPRFLPKSVKRFIKKIIGRK